MSARAGVAAVVGVLVLLGGAGCSSHADLGSRLAEIEREN